MLDRPPVPPGPATPLTDAPPTYREPLPASVGDALVLIGRILIGQLFLVSGFWKVLGPSAFGASLAQRGVPAAEVLGFIGAYVEFLGGLALVVGFKTRWAALALFVFTIIATGIGHRYWEFADAAMRRNQQSHFFKNVTILGGLLFAFVTGAGRFSIDALWRRSAPYR
jgi:putative oxidoreductase